MRAVVLPYRAPLPLLDKGPSASSSPVPAHRVAVCCVPGSLGRLTSRLCVLKLDPCAQHFANTPGLGETATRLMRRCAIEYFAHRAEARVEQMVGNRRKIRLGERRVAIYTKVRQGEGSEKPTPHRTLVIRAIPVPGVSFVPRDIGHIHRT